MRRISKRDIRFKSEMIDRVALAIESFEQGRAVATVDGMTCRIDLTRHERKDLGRTAKIRGDLVS